MAIKQFNSTGGFLKKKLGNFICIQFWMDTIKKPSIVILWPGIKTIPPFDLEMNLMIKFCQKSQTMAVWNACTGTCIYTIIYIYLLDFWDTIAYI